MTPEVFAVILSHLRTARLFPARKKRKELVVDSKYQLELDTTLEYYGIFGTNPCNLEMQSSYLVNTLAEDGTSRSLRKDPDHPSIQSNSGFVGAVSPDAIETTMAWKVHINHSTWKQGIHIGVIASATPAAGSHSSDESSFGWAGCRASSYSQTPVAKVYEAGKEQTHEGWNGWRSGDTAVLMLDLEASELKLCKWDAGSGDGDIKKGRIFSLKLPSKKGSYWRLHIAIKDKNDSVTLSIPAYSTFFLLR